MGDALLKFMRGEAVNIGDYAVSARLGTFQADVVPSGDSLSDAVEMAWFSGIRPSPERLLRHFLDRSGAGIWDVVLLNTLPFYERRYTHSFYAADKIIIVTHPYGAEPIRVKRMYGKLIKRDQTSPFG